MIKPFTSYPRRLLLTIVAAFPSIFAVLITPALPSIATYFELDFKQAQMAMSSFLLGYAFGHLPYGFLSNRFGRKPVLYLGIVITFISCALCLLAGYLHHFPLFVIARFFMAVGACAGLNIAFTMIGDLYENAQALKIFSFVMLLSAVIPGMATFIGGMITEYLQWQSCFYFLMLFSLLMLALVSVFLPETAKQLDRKALHLKEILKSYAAECQNSHLILSAIITGCGASIIYLFASSAPFIGINLIGMGADEFGIWALIPSFGLVAGSIFLDRIALIFPINRLLSLGSKILLAASLLSLAAFYFGHINAWSLFFPMFCIDTGLAIVFSTTAAIALTKAKNKPIGSSLMNFINLGLCVSTVFIIGITSIKNPIVLPCLFLILVLFISFLIGKLKRAISKEETI